MELQDKLKKFSRAPILPVTALVVFLFVEVAAGNLLLVLHILPLCLVGMFFGFTGLAIAFAFLVLLQGILLKSGIIDFFPLGQILLLVIVPIIAAWVAKHLAREKSLARVQRHLLQGLRDGVIISGYDNNIQLINPAACELLKLPAVKEGWKKRLGELGVLKIWDTCLVEKSGPIREEFQIDNNTVDIFVTPVFELGRLTGLVTTVVDYTAERQLSQMREDFLALVSHELRNPLTSINGFTEVLLAENLPDKIMNHIKVIKNNTDRMLRLIRDLLQIRSLEAFSFRLHTETADLADIIRRVAVDMEAKIVQAGIVLQIDYPETAILGKYDPIRLSQVFGNLLDNAIKHSPRGKKILIVISLEHECVLVEIRDQGPGIPKNEIEKIFDKYYRTKDTHASMHVSAGLGLAVCRNLVELHQGHIWATCENGEGTSFWVSLPYGLNDNAESWQIAADNEHTS